jgi:F-type H+-transporting ATPase subunit b
MQIAENMALISINATLLVQLGSFLIFVVIFNRIMVRPLRQMMRQRNDHVQKIVDDIKQADNAFEAINQQIQTQEKKALNTALKIQHRMEEEGQHLADEIVAQTQEEIIALRLKAQRENAAKIAAARREIETAAGPIADQMIAALLGRRSAS